MDARIAAARATLGSRLVILGHHYQRDEVIKFADYTGDSFKLARQIANRPDADYIVFCGVHFMAESADVLCAPHQQVILPDLAAGCSMADMADADQLETCWEELHADGAVLSGDRSGDLHQLRRVDQGVRRRARRHRLHVVERGGDAEVGVRARRARSCSCPISISGRNTAYKMGIPLDEMVVWDPNEIFGGLDPEAVQRARMILWKGHCSVHDALHRAADREHPRSSIPAFASSSIPRCRGTSCRRPTTAAAPNTSSRR